MDISARAKAAIISILLSSVALSQQVQPVAPSKGAYSVGFSAQWFTTASSGNGSTFFVTPAYFVTDSLEIRLPLSIDHSNGAQETIYGLGARLHFAKRNSAGILPRLDPFVGLVAEHATAAAGFREDFWGIQPGVHYFIANNVAITGLLSVGKDRSFGVTQTTTNITAGFAVFFSGK